MWNWVLAVLGLLVLARLAAQLWLDRLNRAFVLAHGGAVPETFRTFIDPATYRKSIDYTLAKNRLHGVEVIGDSALLCVAVFSGVLPWAAGWTERAWGHSAWSEAAFLFATGLALSLAALPLDWHAQFRLEQRFGFNTTTPRLWWTDRLKGLLLGLVLGYPLLVLVLKIVEWTGAHWWIWAWAAVMAFQLLIAVLAPVLIMPLFNKFTPLPDGSLRDRLFQLAQKTRFRARSIQVMDGSKRSRHSNAFFTGFGRFRKIVLFDTLVEQLAPVELEAVLAHEIGHFRRKHILKMLAASLVFSLAGFYLLSVLARQDWFYQAFGFAPGRTAAALLLFGLVAGVFTFWLYPLAHRWSRRHEYEADAFAREAMGEPDSLIGALRKLNEKNLSNLTPHPLYSAFYYSHPTLPEREKALHNAPP